ncbi:MAG: tetratricopeptide repeat protein [Alphaproteobacteria bacterium]|nr:tetratricopeptide repeat protein [Alphaproteobacteria bacterium]
MGTRAEAGEGSSIEALRRQASAAFQAGRLSEAMAVCRTLLAQAPERADAHAFAGMIALRQGDAATAAEAYAAAVALRPDYAEALYNLGNAFKMLDRMGDAEGAYRRVIELRPDLAPAWHNLGNVLLAQERAGDAVDAFGRVIAIDASNPDTHRNLGIALQKLGRIDDAAAYRGALALQPGWPPAASNLVQVLLEMRDPEDAVGVCDEWLARHPGHIEALVLKCASLNDAGDPQALDFLLDSDRFIVERIIDPPPGYRSLAEFNAALADHVVAHPTLKVPPADDPTYHHPKLQITGELLGDQKGPMAVMEAVMRDSVVDYWRRVGDDPYHPFLANRPRKWEISAWSVVLQGEGNLVPHIHLDGYLGGSYYVKLPREVADPDQQEGWFELGRPPEELACHASPTPRAFQPVPGKMLQFPGYFYHGTTPYTSPTGETRITIAFDVVPKV